MKNYLPYLQWIETQYDEMVSTLEGWVNINSGTDNLEGLEVMLSAIQGKFSSLQGEMTVVPLPPRTVITSSGALTEKPLGNALLVTKRPEAKIQVFFSGHMDTVYPKSSSFQKAVHLDRNTMQGPGAADMKGGLVIMHKVLEALERSPFKENIGWTVFINSDEEIGSVGSCESIIKYSKGAQVGLVFEPAYHDGAIVSSRKGSFNFTVVSRGIAAHAGRNFHEGHNAITSLMRFILKVEALNNRERGITVNVGYIEGGIATNIVPDLAICLVNARMNDRKDFEAFKEELYRLLAKENEITGVNLVLHENSERCPKPFDEAHQALFEEFKSCARELDYDLKWAPSGGVTDGNITASIGIPTIDTLGVIGKGIHTFSEQADLRSLVQRGQMTSLFLFKLANGEVHKL